MDIKKLVRKEIENFQAYVPGKPINEVKRELGIKGNIVKLASNENSLGASKKVIAAIKKAASEVYRYPEGVSYELRKAMAAKTGVNFNEVLFGSGSDEIIELLGKVFLNPGDEIVVSKHAFIRYKMAGDLMGCSVVTVPMKNYTHDLPAMAAVLNVKTKMIFIANPNNPTGTYNTGQELESFLEGLAKKGDTPPLVIVDEAYYEFALIEKKYPDSVSLLKKYPNLVILRTFSKIYALAGLRAGYAIANSEVIGYLDRIRPPFNITLITQYAVLAALKDEKTQIKKALKVVENGKKYLYAELEKIGLKYIKTVANFILVESAPKKGKDVFNQLLKKGVIVRAMDEYELPFHFRVTVGKKNENSIFIKELKNILEE
ncbi:MAG: histidinol-phosphate transaminase [Elusimicrobia bacterium RIFOXYA2_FULL_39_19]|nr:MAG: histidinol-phosphate transaminase [Elusimicrobia bacterium RIFOXYA2_FULL_39_19]